MKERTVVTYPYDALVAALGGASQEKIAVACGVSPRTVNRWSMSGRIQWWFADRAAVAAGFHPSEIWPEFFEFEAVS